MGLVKNTIQVAYGHSHGIFLGAATVVEARANSDPQTGIVIKKHFKIKTKKGNFYKEDMCDSLI